MNDIVHPKYSTLTGKQRVFAEQYVLNGGDAVAAYLEAYDEAYDQTAEEIEANCTRLLVNSNVYYHIGHIQRQDNKRFDIDIEFLTRKLLKALAIAEMHQRSRDIQSAVMDLAKLHGFLVEQHDILDKRKFQTMKDVTINGDKLIFDIGAERPDKLLEHEPSPGHPPPAPTPGEHDADGLL